jgi:predicted lipoprotein with Yx(FWY)xxD motif
MLRITLLVPALLCASFALAAAEPEAPAEAGPPIRKLDGPLVDLKGRGLYTWDGDKTPGRSSCNSQCRILWPPIVAAAGAQPKGSFGLVKRDDGTQQWAFRGKPLYRWTSDKKHGDAGGDGVSGVWRLVMVAAKPADPKPGDASPGASAPATSDSKTTGLKSP